MLNAYAVTSQFVVDLFDSDPLVNTIIFGATDNRDLNKANIFPLVHIMPSNVQMVDNAIDITFDIAVVDIRDIRTDSNESKIFGDNLIDSLNQSIAILMKAFTKIDLKNNEWGIELVDSSAATPIIFQDKNLLDGYECSVTLSIQNQINTCE